MQRFVLTNVIRADIESVYDVLCRPESYQSVIPDHYPSVRVRSVRGDTMVAEEHVRLGGRELVIMAKHVSKPPHLHETFVIGGDAKRTHITYELAQEDESNTATANDSNAADSMHTIVTTTVRFNTGKLAFISRLHATKSIEESFKNVICDLARIAESTA